ncbi:MAG TPA: AMP-binding protein, partial [Acetobacteraceae bacterium]|nr:AMP-binding protein [Acetobacteraceae bacterium]
MDMPDSVVHGRGVWTPARLITALAAYGDRPAILSMAGETVTALSGTEVAAQAQRLAGGLMAAGLARGEHAAIWAPNSPDWIMVRLALGAAGALPFSIDDLASDAEAEAILADAGAAWVFCSSAHAAAARREGRRVVLVDAADGAEGWQALCAEAPGPLPDLAPDDEALVVYTSGTTGAPKSFALTHAHLQANLDGILAERLIGPADRMLVPLPLHHVYPFLLGLMVPIAHGSAIVLPEAVTGPQLVTAMRHARPTVMIGVPRLYVALLAGLEARVAQRGALARRVFGAMLSLSTSLRKADITAGGRLFGSLHAQMAPALRLMVCGGARLEPDAVWRLEALGWRVLNGYGLAETASMFTGNLPRRRRVGSEGMPIAPGAEIRIAEPDALGVGEILLRGPNVFAGYRNNPEANATAFTPDGWFRTGDLGRLDTDGFLHVTGRLKEMIVLGGGKNIMPEELEKTYAAHPHVQEIAVLERAGALVAIVVPDEAALRASGTQRAEDAIRVALTETGQGLASFQRLAGFVLAREALPRTRLGKYQRFRLPALYDALQRGEPVRAPAPLSPEDAALIARPGAAEVWAILRARYPDKPLSPGAHPALDLGMDSLEWVGLALEIEQRTGLRLSEEETAAMTTVRALLERAASGDANPSAPAAPAWDPALWTAPTPAGAGLVRGAGRALARGIGRAMFSLRVQGAENLPGSGPLVIVANHVSDLDPGLLYAALPPALARLIWWSGVAERLFTSPAKQRLARAFQIFPVDERTPGATVAMARAVLERGEAL